VEALLEQLAPESANKRKLLKQLSRLRNKAGKVRDLDVQIAFLKELKVPDRQGHRVQLLEILAEEKSKRSKKLVSSFNSDEVRKLRKRLKKNYSELKLDGVDPLKLAFASLPKAENPPATDKALHSYRISAKHARYLAELAPSSPAAKTFIQELKRAQDAMGEWHDTLKLSQRAEKLFGSVRDSALVSALQNIARAKFRRASSSLLETLRNISSLQGDTTQSPPVHKPSQSPVTAVARTAAA
jgi:CHAD domain-containing protein